MLIVIGILFFVLLVTVLIGAAWQYRPVIELEQMIERGGWDDIRMGALTKSIDLNHPLVDPAPDAFPLYYTSPVVPRGQHNTALLTLMKTIEAEIAIRQNPPQSITSDMPVTCEQPAYDAPSVDYTDLS